MTLLILIVGPSGSGKDTLIRACREYFRDWKRVNFCKRYITRPPDENEDNFYVCKRGFEVLKREGFFGIFWEAYNYMYGIPFYEIKSGHCNFISVSRSVIKDVEKRYSRVITLCIQADKNEVKKRLFQRKREPEDIIERRLRRYDVEIQASHKITFINQGDIEDRKKEFISLCKGLIKRFPGLIPGPP